MLVLFAAAVLAHPATISLTIRGATVANAVRQIGESTGLTLRTRAPIQNQMVLVHVQDTPVEALLEHLAEAVHGEWLEEGDARVLTRSAKLQTALVKEQRDRQAKPLNDHLQALVRSQRPWTEDHGRELAKQILQAQARRNANQDPAAEDNLSRLHDQLPFQAALVQLLTKIGAERFAGLGPVERIVFSNKPNARQHRLPDGCNAVLRSLSANVRMFEQEVLRRGGGVIGYSGGPSRAFEPDARVTLAIHNDRARLRISAEPYSTSLWFGAFYSQPPQTVRYPQISIALSPNAKWIADWWQSRTGLTEPPAPLGAIRPYLLAPADSPRIGTLVYEVLDALGVYDRRQWVAWIPLFAQLPWIPSTPRARIRVLEIGQLVAQIANRQQGRSQGYPGDMADQYLYGSQSVFHLRLVFRGGRSKPRCKKPPCLRPSPRHGRSFQNPSAARLKSD